MAPEYSAEEELLLSLDDEDVDSIDKVRELARKIVQESKKKSQRLQKVLKQSDAQQKQLLVLHKELDSYKNHLEEKVEEGLSHIKALNKEIEDTQREVVFTMGAIGESRSKETGNHVKRVAEYSKLLGLYWGMDEDEAELLKQASPMHDIGKVAIPDAILNKPGKLDTDEYDKMKTHTTLGYEMLRYSNRTLMLAASVVAYEHHERWDGKGYPHGKAGDEIHIYGRITALADVFDALCSNRCYKNAWDDEKIFTLFQEERGKQFDPNLVDLFFKNIDEFLAIRSAFSD